MKIYHRLCFVVMVVATTCLTRSAPVDTTIYVDKLWKVADLDNDQVVDTLFVRVQTHMRDSHRIRTNSTPLKILWGDASPQSSNDRDTTHFDLPSKRKLSAATSVYDANEDGYVDIVVTYWWTDSTDRRVHERTWAFLGGSALRERRNIQQNSASQSFGNVTYATRVTQEEISGASRLGIGGFAIRARPKTSDFSKRPGYSQREIFQNQGVKLFISPNPVHEILNIRAPGIEPEKQLTIVLSDLAGKVCLSLASSGLELEEMVQIQVGTLSRGQYTIRLQSEGALVASGQVVILK